MCKLCYYTIHIDRPRTGCKFAGNLHVNATFPAGRIISAPTFSEQAASVNVGAIIVSRATWFTDCATTWFTHLLLDRPQSGMLS